MKQFLIVLMSFVFCAAFSAERKSISLKQGMNCGYAACITGNSSTIELWTYMTATEKSGIMVSNHGNEKGFLMGFDGWFKLQVGNESLWIDPASWVDQWIHLACVIDGGNKKMSVYVNGVSVGTQSCVAGYPGYADGSALWIGKASWGSPYTGKIADFRVWNSARTQEEIKASMNELETQAQMPVIYYNFSEGAGEMTDNLVTDSGENNGWIVGGPSNALWETITSLYSYKESAGLEILRLSDGWQIRGEAKHGKIRLIDITGKVVATAVNGFIPNIGLKQGVYIIEAEGVCPHKVIK